MTDTETATITPVEYPDGSEWRRWDLHIHTPASVLSNGFGGDWEAYVARIEAADTSIAALAPTDYLSLEGYKRLLEYRKQGRLKNVKLLMPNIELRFGPKLDKGNPLNIHLIVSPDDANHVEEIESALTHLTFTYGGKPYACSDADFIRLGKQYDKTAKTKEEQRKIGMLEFKPTWDVFRDWYNSQGWLKQHSLIVIPNGNDGVAGFPLSGGFGATREELLRLSHAVFSGNPKDRAHFLGQSAGYPAAKIIEMYGSLKPCIHGSDAHDLKSMFEPAQQRYCWIKADPTFEGLRQILHEPEERVCIGPTPPTPVDRSRIIKTIALSGNDDWFPQSAVPLNAGLVAIIGEKGSGKTALVDLIAHACGAWSGEESSSSFIAKAEETLAPLTVKVQWADGESSTSEFHDSPAEGSAAVRYLTQDFVEKLCSGDTSASALVHAIEEVVFSHLDEWERLDASDFAELRRAKTEYLESRRTSIRESLSGLNKEIVGIEVEVASRPAKVTSIADAKKALAAVDAQLPELQKGVDSAVSEKLSQLRASLQEKQTALATANRLATRADHLQSAMTDFRGEIRTGFQALVDDAEAIGISRDSFAKFEPTLDKEADKLVAVRKTALATMIKTLRGDPQAPSPTGQAIADLQEQIKTLEKQLATDEELKKRLVGLQKQREKLLADIGRLERELKRIDTTLSKQLSAKKNERLSQYLSYFEVLKEETSTLEALYAPVTTALEDDKNGAKSGFALNVQQTADHEGWLETGRALFDQRSTSTIFRSKELEACMTALRKAWSGNDAKEIRAALQQFETKLVDEGKALQSVLTKNASVIDVYDWLFSPEHVTVEYGLRYNGTELSALSPGQRGIILLVLYLELDRTDTRPLLIDQPEGNLDNSSIFDSLVPFLRRAKTKRQIILVTHNPNLVVGTDADQVIVATAEKQEGWQHPRIVYRSGSLENAKGKTSIRESVCRLLEGGRYAFQVRERKYSLPVALDS